MSRGIARFYVHTVSVATWLGAGPSGDVFATPSDVVGFFDGGTKLVRGTNGEQVVASASFFTDPSNAALFTPESLVIYNGNTSRAITVLPHILGTPADNVEVALV